MAPPRPGTQQVTTPGSWLAHSLPFFNDMHVRINQNKILDHDGPKPIPTLSLDAIHLGPTRIATQRCNSRV